MSVSLKPIMTSNGGFKRAQAFAGRHLLLQVDPLQYPGWDSLLTAHADRSVFHTAAWARVLVDTYGHEPAYFTHFYGGDLVGLLPVMKVSSPFLGRRAVSLPFTDFCNMLAGREANRSELYKLAFQWARESGCRYIEFRGNGSPLSEAAPSLVFYGHVINLRHGLESLFDKLDGAVRRGIRKAQESGVEIDFGTDTEAVRVFYGLHCRTRRRHGLPPQPYGFFRNIAQYVLQHGLGFVATARWRGRPIASAIFLHHGRRAIYKYGASDYAFQQLRPNNLLMWRAIEWFAEHRFDTLHLGRTSLANDGLRRFKLGFGAQEEKIAYYKFDMARGAFVTEADGAEGWYNRIFQKLPVPVLRLIGALLYPHVS